MCQVRIEGKDVISNTSVNLCTIKQILPCAIFPELSILGKVVLSVRKMQKKKGILEKNEKVNEYFKEVIVKFLIEGRRLWIMEKALQNTIERGKI